MNKWVVFSGFMVALVLLNQINSKDLTLNDVMMAMETKDSVEVQKSKLSYFSTFLSYNNLVERAFKAAENTDKYDDNLRGAIIPSEIKNAKTLANFFRKLSNTQKVETFVLIGRNSSFADPYQIAVASQGFDTSFENLELAEDFISDLLDEKDMNIGESTNAFAVETSIISPAIFIKKSFPNAKIVPIVIKDSASAEELNALAEKLYDLTDENTIILASTSFSQQMDKHVAAFHDELSMNLFESFDVGGLDQAEIGSKAVLSTFMGYLNLVGARAANIEWRNFDTNSELLVSFSKGDPVAQRDLHIMAFGDVMLGRYVRSLIDEYGSKDYVFKNIKGFDGRFFKGADTVFANLEGPIKGQGKKGGTAMSFSFNEDVAQFLKENGFNLVSLANNHAVDQGWVGRETTIEALNTANLNWCGHPSEADKNSVYYGEIGDKKFAFACFHDITFKLKDAAALELIKEIRSKVDYLVVSIHWGIEYQQRADWSSQIEPGRAFIDAGADFVIGHHPHVVQNFEIYKGKPIFYSLGNFVFDQYWSEMTQEELALGIVLGKDATKVYLFPMKSERSQSRLMNEEERANWLDNYLLYGNYSEDLQAQILNGVVEVK